MDIKDSLNKIIDGNNLSVEEAHSIVLSIGRGEVNEYQIASLLTCLQMRPIVADELLGFRNAMIDLSVHIDLDEFDAIDIVGTGGDGKNTFNISTLSAIVVAGAGYKVAKHGNVGKSSVSGSSNVLEYHGYSFSNNVDKLRYDLEKNNFCFMHAPLFHPAMKYVSKARSSLRIPTFFNILGPLLNPAKVRKQLTGVSAPFILPLYKSVLDHMGSKYALLYSIDGYDEISLTDDFKYLTNDSNKVMSPQEIGFGKINPESLYGGENAESAAQIFLNILEGAGSKPQQEVVLANAAMAIRIFKPLSSIQDCIEEAKESIDSRRALAVLKNMSLNS